MRAALDFLFELDMTDHTQLGHRRPRHRSATICRFAATACFILSCAASPLSAADFRVTTRIFEGSKLDAAAEHVILFNEGLVYDFPQIDTRYVTVYDAAQNRVTLLDRQTQVQTTLSVDSLIQVTAQARSAARTPEQREHLGLQAKVERSSRVNGYTVRFGNLEYHVTTQRPGDPSVAADFARFADLASRLNIVRRLGPPPFGRMTLNQHIASMAELPLETTLTLHRGDEAHEFRSTHLLQEIDSISDQDRKLIEEARGMMAVYRQVDMKSFP